MSDNPVKDYLTYFIKEEPRICSLLGDKEMVVTTFSLAQLFNRCVTNGRIESVDVEKALAQEPKLNYFRNNPDLIISYENTGLLFDRIKENERKFRRA